MLCGQIFGATYVETLVSDQTVVRPLSINLWELGSDYSAILPSDQTVARPLSRPSCGSSVSPIMYFWLHHATSVRPKWSDLSSLGSRT